MQRTLAEELGVPTSEKTAEYERYVIASELGAGGMGRVYRAHDQKLNRDVAVKVMVGSESAGDTEIEDLRARFHREAKIVAAMRHPNVLQILDYSGPSAPVPFIVTELLDGTDLEALIDAGPIPERVAAAIVYYAALAAAHAHKQEIIHRDIKPHNIFIEHTGRVVLIDFGVAKGMRSSHTRATLMASRTQVVGTMMFSSPEQLRSKTPPGPLGDVFSLGAVLYYAITQMQPFNGKNLKEVLDNLQHRDPPDPRDLVRCSDPMWSLIKHALAKTPESRLPGAEAMARGLKPLAADPSFVSFEETIAAFLAGQQMDKTSVTAQVAISGETSHTTPPGSRTEIVTATRIGATKVVTVPSKSEKPSRRAGQIAVAVAVLATVLLASVAVYRVTHRAKPVVVTTPIIATPLPPPVVAAQNARLRVVVKPWGRVQIDGTDHGTTPVFRVAELPVGTHKVHVTNPDFGERDIEVILPEPNREEMVVVDFTAKP